MSVTKNYLSLVKFSHTIFAMPFALIGFFLGIRNTDISDQSPNATGILPTMWNKTVYLFREKGWVFLLVLLCMIFARNAAMSFNRYLDRKYDALNPRTAVREIPAGILSARSVLWFTVLNSVLFIVATYFINPVCFYLSPVALLVVLGYSYTKRFTALCHLVLGLGLSLAPIGAYLAVTGAFDTLPILFSFAVLFWVSGFDIIYALQDEGFDRTNQLYSIPSVLGGKRALRVSELLHILSATAVIAAAFKGGFGGWYWAGVVVFVGMLIYQHSIVKATDLRRVNLAFMTANGIASVVFAVFVIADLFLR
ncbi:putative 4-hydroxybenzoate polyprenyltransferase [Niabella pedocola]|uniref:4-hydroxybenzoate polyprenyltransferase n=1 Tax=Niabella pedocola TaxID=1752077 RepID=A0ABS8PP95_9BACT|nr:UbiA-like polyprenyltransferase [Niabella pedocola]MCD2422887.1 putative 4-hydroxybenzoate polyprenyltransferase [Niabella pedocola]